MKITTVFNIILSIVILAGLFLIATPFIQDAVEGTNIACSITGIFCYIMGSILVIFCIGSFIYTYKF